MTYCFSLNPTPAQGNQSAMQNMPLVSVIIPTHNRPELLLEALASIAGQTMTDWQVIIVDDGSSPIVNEQEIKAQFSNKFRVISVWKKTK